MEKERVHWGWYKNQIVRSAITEARAPVKGSSIYRQNTDHVVGIGHDTSPLFVKLVLRQSHNEPQTPPSSWRLNNGSLTSPVPLGSMTFPWAWSTLPALLLTNP